MYEHSVTDVIRELEYPSREALRIWHHEQLEKQRTGRRVRPTSAVSPQGPMRCGHAESPSDHPRLQSGCGRG